MSCQLHNTKELCNIAKWPHHGSSNVDCAAFLRWLVACLPLVGCSAEACPSSRSVKAACRTSPAWLKLIAEGAYLPSTVARSRWQTLLPGAECRSGRLLFCSIHLRSTLTEYAATHPYSHPQPAPDPCGPSYPPPLPESVPFACSCSSIWPIAGTNTKCMGSHSQSPHAALHPLGGSIDFARDTSSRSGVKVSH